MGAKNPHRWAYMGRPAFNPPNDDCPQCEQPSKTFFRGAKLVDGIPQSRYECEHGHQWIVRGPPTPPARS